MLLVLASAGTVALGQPVITEEQHFDRSYSNLSHVAISRNWMAAGSPNVSPPHIAGNGVGHVRLWALEGCDWVEKQVLIPPDSAQSYSGYGAAIVLEVTDEVGWLVVGEPGYDSQYLDDNGALWVYWNTDPSSPSSTWEPLTGYLIWGRGYPSSLALKDGVLLSVSGNYGDTDSQPHYCTNLWIHDLNLFGSGIDERSWLNIVFPVEWPWWAAPAGQVAHVGTRGVFTIADFGMWSLDLTDTTTTWEGCTSGPFGSALVDFWRCADQPGNCANAWWGAALTMTTVETDGPPAGEETFTFVSNLSTYSSDPDPPYDVGRVEIWQGWDPPQFVGTLNGNPTFGAEMVAKGDVLVISEHGYGYPDWRGRLHVHQYDDLTGWQLTAYLEASPPGGWSLGDAAGGGKKIGIAWPWVAAVGGSDLFVFNLSPDGDQDGLEDCLEIPDGCPDPTCPDTDGDGTLDGEDPASCDTPPTVTPDYALAGAAFVEDPPDSGTFIVTEGVEMTVPFTIDDEDVQITATADGLPAGSTVEPLTGDTPFDAVFTWTAAYGDPLPAEVIIWATDSYGQTGQGEVSITAINRRPSCFIDGAPVIEAPADTSEGAWVTLTGGGSDPDPEDVLTYMWNAGESIAFDDPTNPAGAAAFFPMGEPTEASLTVDDGRGGVSSTWVMVQVVESNPPEIACAAAEMLWPPNHKMRQVTITIYAENICNDPEANPDCVLPLMVTISSNEPDNATGMGDGNTTGDVNGHDGYSQPVIVTDLFVFDESIGELGAWTATVELRAEREGTGTGRSYTIHATAFNCSCDFATCSSVVIVPHDRRGGGG